MNGFALFAALVVGHALADYPLQGDFLARAKNRTAPIPGVPWFWALGSHAAIHGGMVALILWLFHAPAPLVAVLGVGEALCHAYVDDGKCRGVIGFNTDQTLHLWMKLLWAVCFGAVLP